MSLISKKYIGNNIPHVGMSFEDGKYEINHNYMHSLWAVLILMATCSFIAQKRWSSIFNNDILRALLKLPGHENLSVVKKAQNLAPFEIISKFSPKNESSEKETFKHDDNYLKQLPVELVDLSKVNDFSESIDILTGYENEHNHTLDYYPNQLIYLLLPRQTVAYKMSGLKLRRDLIVYSIWSFSLTLMQFLLPLVFIGKNYKYYGLDFSKAWLKYTLKQLKNPRSNVNSINYQLSSQIFPISVRCPYRQFGLQGAESVYIQCTVPINEICGKLFVVIWWFIIVNIFIEIYSMLCILIGSINFGTIKWCIGRRSWPKAQREAKKLATFRYRHAASVKNQKAAFLKLTSAETKQDSDEHLLSKKHSTLVQMEAVTNNRMNNSTKTKTTTTTNTDNKKDKRKNNNIELSEAERKIHEAQAEKDQTTSSSCLSSKKWYYWCFKDIGLYLSNKGRRICGKKMPFSKKDSSAQRTKWRTTLEDKGGCKEIREDSNIYYLLYLLYMRLNRSKKKIERIIRMSSSALEKYLRNLDEYMLEERRMVKDSDTREDNGKEDEEEEGGGEKKRVKKLIRDTDDDEEEDKSSGSSVTTMVNVATY